MSLWSRIASDVSDVLLNATDGLTCTALQLPNGQSFTGFYTDVSAEEDKQFGIANTIKGRLWIPVAATPQQRSMWQVTLPDGSIIEASGTCHGERSGGLVCVHLEKTDVSKFAGVFSGAMK